MLECAKLKDIQEIINGFSVEDQSENKEINRVIVLYPEGVYERSSPVLADCEELEPDLAPLMRDYFNVLRQAFTVQYIAELPNALVTGQGAVITNHGNLLRNSVAEFVAHERTPDGLEKNQDGTFSIPNAVSRRIDKPALLLKRPWYQNFGHWLVDHAGLLHLAAGVLDIEEVVLVTGCYGSPRMKEVVDSTVAFLGKNVEVIEIKDDEVCQFDKLLYATPVHVPPLFKLPASLECVSAFSKAVENGNLGSGGHPSRIFISRRQAGTRHLVNEREVFEIASQFGFEMVFPEDYDFPTQIRLFSGAEAVIGTKGAALTNLVFSTPGCLAVVLSPSDFIDPFFWDVAGQRNVKYAEIFGSITTEKPRGLNDFRISPERLHSALKNILVS